MNIEELRDYCLSLPHVTEDIKWGNNLCFLIAEKMWCVTDTDGPFAAGFKVPVEDFDELSTQAHIMPAPYMARNSWVKVNHEDALSRSEWEQLLKQSYDLVVAKLPKKKQAELQ